jgi:hypothetical protein
MPDPGQIPRLEKDRKTETKPSFFGFRADRLGTATAQMPRVAGRREHKPADLPIFL